MSTGTWVVGRRLKMVYRRTRGYTSKKDTGGRTSTGVLGQVEGRLLDKSETNSRKLVGRKSWADEVTMPFSRPDHRKIAEQEDALSDPSTGTDNAMGVELGKDVYFLDTLSTFNLLRQEQGSEYGNRGPRRVRVGNGDIVTVSKWTMVGGHVFGVLPELPVLRVVELEFLRHVAEMDIRVGKMVMKDGQIKQIHNHRIDGYLGKTPIVAD